MARSNDSNEDDFNKKQGDDSDDTFGLPEIEYNPINRTEESSSSTEETTSENVESQSQQYEYQPQETKRDYTPYVPEEEDAPVWPKVLGILLVVLIAAAAALYFIWYKPNQEKEKLAEKQRQEQEAIAKKEKDRLAAEASTREAEERRIADSLANVPKTGVYEQLSAPTGRYYVIIARAVDGDFIMDHAKKLSTTGVSTKIIPPYGKYKFYRLTIAEGDTYAAAQEIADSKKADFGENTWVLKY
jgi:hypothetical protein